MAKRKFTKKHKSFSDLHGSKSDMFKGVTGEQLGHDQQMAVNPPLQGGSPLLDPGSPGHPIRPEEIGQSMYKPSEDYNG